MNRIAQHAGPTADLDLRPRVDLRPRAGFFAGAAAEWDKDEVRRATLDALPTHVLTLDEGNRIVAVNEPWRRFTLESAPQLPASGIGLDYVDVCRQALGADDEQARLIRAGFEQLRRGEQNAFSLIVPSAGDGQERALLLRATPLQVGMMAGIVAIHSDVSEHLRSERRLSHLAHHDSLTALPNRLLFRDRLQSALALSRRNHWMLAVLFVDLDRFKTINDTLGHEVGDQLLQEAARRLMRSVRDCDTVCRLGGDEFALVLPELGDMHEAAQVPQRIVESLRLPVIIEGHELNVSASIGIALFPVDAEDPEVLLRCADVAMYHAKKLGRNNYQFYTAAMTAEPTAPIKLR
jgi:diguanylate cyclase (GGDEF)-like protein